MKDEDPSLSHACRDEIIKAEVMKFQEMSRSEHFNGANIIYVTVEKPLKLKFFIEGDSHPSYNRESPTYIEHSPKSLLIQEGVSHQEDSELFFMKETRGDASHYPLRVRVRSGVGGDMGPGRKGRVEKKTIDEVSRSFFNSYLLFVAEIPKTQIFQATYDYPPGIDSATLPAPIYFARRVSVKPPLSSSWIYTPSFHLLFERLNNVHFISF